jgi:hypothetical protein
MDYSRKKIFLLSHFIHLFLETDETTNLSVTVSESWHVSVTVYPQASSLTSCGRHILEKLIIIQLV